jgi:hypothetical protein
MHNKAAWPSGVWMTSGTASSHRIIDRSKFERLRCGFGMNSEGRIRIWKN